MRVRKEIGRGEMIPAWYGVAWVDFMRDVGVCYPIPLNLIAAVLRGLWIWAMHGYRAVPIDSRDAYAQGFADGRRSADRYPD